MHTLVTRSLAMTVRRWAALVLVGSLFLSAAPSGPGAETAAQGAANLTAALGAMAGDLHAYLEKDARQSAIAVGSFVGPPSLASSSGAVIKKFLTDELTRLKINCNRQAKLSFEGRYSFDEVESKVVLKAHVFDGSNQLTSFDREVYDVEDIASLLGVTGKLALDNPQRAEDLKASIQDPKVAIIDSPQASQVRVGATADSPYTLEIHVKDPASGEYVPRPAINDEGQAFVKLEEGEVYAIKVINSTPFAAAVTLTIDGLNLFAFSENDAFCKLGKVLIPASSEGFLVKGWHINNNQSAEFQVAEAANAAVADIKRLGVVPFSSNAEVGTITASFAVAMPASEPFPPDEPLTQSLLATKQGARIDQKYKGVPMKIGRLREAVSVRYSKP